MYFSHTHTQQSMERDEAESMREDRQRARVRKRLGAWYLSAPRSLKGWKYSFCPYIPEKATNPCNKHLYF